MKIIPIIPSDNLSRDLEFYGRLGFMTDFNVSDDGVNGIARVSRGEAKVTLDCPMDGHGRGACISIETEDADALFAEWSAVTRIDGKPQNQFWGARTFALEDPSGNTIFVIGPIVGD